MAAAATASATPASRAISTERVPETEELWRTTIGPISERKASLIRWRRRSRSPSEGCSTRRRKAESAVAWILAPPRPIVSSAERTWSWVTSPGNQNSLRTSDSSTSRSRLTLAGNWAPSVLPSSSATANPSSSEGGSSVALTTKVPSSPSAAENDVPSGAPSISAIASSTSSSSVSPRKRTSVSSPPAKSRPASNCQRASPISEGMIINNENTA